MNYLTEPSYAELISIFESSASNSSIHISDKRRASLLRALRIADAGLVEAMRELLNYTGGWDLPIDSDHPISKARAVLERVDLLIDHPPCHHLAQPFDLSTLTFGARYLLGQLRNGPHLRDADQRDENYIVLQQHGLVSIDEQSYGTYRIALTLKGQAAR